MRRPFIVLASSIFALAFSAAADVIVLKDGQVIQTQGPYKTKGSQAVVKRSDGTLIAIPLAEIDREKSATATAKAKEPQAAPPVSPSRLSPADIARMRSPRKAGVVLTDQDVSHTVGGGGETGKTEEEGRVEVGSTKETRTDKGIKITGSVANMGKGDVTGVAVTIEAIGEDNKTVNSIFANVAQDHLAPGEKSSFDAELPSTETPIRTFRYVPRWKYIPKPAAGEAGAAPATTGTPGEQPAEAPKPAPAPAPKAAPTAPPRPDIAAPQANAPVGAPSQPGQSYLPPPSGEQAKPVQ